MIPRNASHEELAAIAELDRDPDPDDSDEERRRDIELATEARQRLAPIDERWQQVPADRLRTLTHDGDDVTPNAGNLQSNRRRASQRNRRRRSDPQPSRVGR